MAENMIDLNGLVHVWSKVKTLTDNCVKTTDIATVATSGSYNDLSDKPTIPSAYTLPTASNTVMGGVKIGSNISVSSGTISITKSNVTSALGYTPPTSDTVYNNATTSTAGLMSASDKVKLNSIAANANNYTHPSTHPASMITGLASVATSGSYNDLTDKPTIPAASTVDSELSSTSTNPVQNKVINAALNRKADSSMLSDYLPLAGGVCTGGVSAPNFRTGTGATNYFQCQKFRGEGDANAYYHAVDFGYSGHDSVDFYEYDPNWNFYKCTTGTKSGAVLVGNINRNGWNGGAVLSGTPTAPTATVGTNTTQIATTAFVQTAVGSKVDASLLATVATSGSYNDLADKPVIPGAYTLPNATSSTLGGVKIGNNISVTNGTISLSQTDVTSALGYTPPTTNTDTHWTTGLKVGASATATANAAATNGNVFLNVLDNTTVRDFHNIVGSGATTVTSDANGKITISSTNTVYTHPTTHPASMITGLATVATSGSYNDLTNKPTIPAAYSLPDATASVKGGVKIGSNLTVSSGTISLTKANVTSALGYTPPASDTTYGDATTTSSGLMSSTDKVKLNGIADNANYYIHPPTHPASMISGLATVATSGNYNDLANKPGDATTSSAGLMSAADKSKLDGISSDAGSVKMIVYS